MAKNEYPRLWQLGLIQKRVRERANHLCEQCGMEFVEGTNLAKEAKNRDGNATIGTVHHIDMDKQNCSKANLVFLCQRCHFTVHLYNWIPGDELPKRWKHRIPQWILDRELPYSDSKSKQLPLFEWGAS